MLGGVGDGGDIIHLVEDASVDLRDMGGVGDGGDIIHLVEDASVDLSAMVCIMYNTYNALLFNLFVISVFLPILTCV